MDKLPALLNGDPGAHGMNRVQAKHKQNGMDGGKQNERGKQNVEGQWAWQAKWQAGKQNLLNRYCRRTQPVDSPSGTGLKQTAHSWPALQQKHSRR